MTLPVDVTSGTSTRLVARMTLDVVRTLYHRGRSGARRWRGLHLADWLGPDARHLRALARDGYSVIEHFASRREVEEWRHALDDVMRDYHALLWTDPQGSDRRAYNCQAVSPALERFAVHAKLKHLAEAYVGAAQDLFFTLGGDIAAKDGGLGSGGGWHRDTPHNVQFKALLYLDDVTEKNGPFQYMRGSHRVRVYLELMARARVRHAQYRFTDEEIERMTRATRIEVSTHCAPAGTLILADTSGIHRGAPPLAGRRRALTNYYYTPETIQAARSRRKFIDYFVDRQRI
jgi:hypothetical protein